MKDFDQLMSHMRQVLRNHPLSIGPQALYAELSGIYRDANYPLDFQCSNRELSSALRVSEKAMIKFREELISAGLIFFKSGNSMPAWGVYSFIGEIGKA